MNKHVPGCTGKKRYKNGGEVVSAANRMVMKFGGAYRPYPCKHCNGWHLTSQMVGNRPLDYKPYKFISYIR